MNEVITTTQIQALVDAGKLKELHTSTFRGYVSRKKHKDGIAEKYDGKFGKGYVIRRPNWQSTGYSYITYYIWQ